VCGVCVWIKDAYELQVRVARWREKDATNSMQPPLCWRLLG